ncbi:hypothetical protein BKA83DRAFT_1015746 [Pisolithus microcarpus]|nr:hypothetical protein BKA83DRAFT_1015746 [Pisolithus microcarpus]
MIFYAFCNHNYQFYPRFPWPRHMGQLFDLLVCPNHSSIAALRSLWWLEESSDHDSLRPGRGGRRHDCVRRHSSQTPQTRSYLSLESKISEFPNVALKIYVNYSAVIACECSLFSLAVVAAVRRHREKLGPLPASWDGVRRLGDIVIQGNVLYFPVVMIYCIVYLVVSLTLPVS